MTVLGYFLSIQLVFFQFYMGNSLCTYNVELVSHCGLDERNCHGSASCCKGFDEYCRWTRSSCVKVSCPHLWYYKKKRKKKNKTNAVRDKQPTWKTQIALNSILTHVRFFSSVTNSFTTINSSWKMEVLNTAKKNLSKVEKVTAPI